MTIPKEISTIPPELSFNLFAELLDRYAEIAAIAGMKAQRSKPEQARKMFLDLPDLSKQRLMNRLMTDVSIFEEAQAAEESLKDGRLLLWRYFKKNKITPLPDLFDKISETDLIQVYSPEQYFLFASLNFFDHLSCTLEQIFYGKWNQMTRREPQIIRQIVNAYGQILSGEIRKTVDIGNPWHLVEEVGTEMLLKFWLRIKWISPAYAGQELANIIVIAAVSGNEKR